MRCGRIGWRLAIGALFALALTTAASAANNDDMGSMVAMDMGNTVATSIPASAGQADAMSSIENHDPHMAAMSMVNMKKHMKFTELRPANPADEERGRAIAAELKASLAKYEDFHAAEAAGFKPFHPEIKQLKVVHFTKKWNGFKAAFTFNPADPTSLLYERTADGGYKLIGAMYTAPRRWSEDKLNARVPLSLARWHQHIDWCLPKKGTPPATVDWKEFGPNGLIATRAQCDAAGGRFYPVVFGWMVHIYPWATNPQQVWAH